MAYTNTTWNNLSDPPINAENLNKIEQGIYDNSLGIDKINPSGTATTTAEIEEGQVTDVIGFKSLKLKGQTSQGENPSPDSPQEVNNVSGYNEINICGKNLFDKDNIISGYRLDGSGNPSSSANNEFTSDFIPVKSGTTYIRSYGNINAYTRTCFYDKNKSFVSKNDDSQSFTIPINVKYIRFSEYLSKLDTMQLEQGSSVTSYIAHQGNNFDIDLPVENLFFLPEATITNGIEYTINNDGTFNVYGTASANTTISLLKDLTLTKIKANNYAFSVNQTLPVGVEIRVEGFNGNTWKRHLGGSPLNSSNSIKNGTADLTDVNKIRTSIYVPSGKSVDMKNVAVQFEKGSAINSFTPFGVTPIYLGKIGTYCNDIRKYNGKWYWHKEIGKIVIDEIYNWTRETSSSWVCPRFYCTTLPDLGTTVNGTVFNNSLCNMATVGSTSDYTQNENAFLLRRVNNTNRIDCMFDLESVDDLKSILANENMLVYYGLITPIDEEITYAPLLRQLDELYNSGLYDVTNISQDNSSEAFILDLEACKNNINGIVEYIRR